MDEKHIIAVIVPKKRTMTTLAALFNSIERKEVSEMVDLDNLINKKEERSTMSNYNEEMAKLFEECGLTGFELRELTDSEKATPEDWARLEQRIALRTAENARMLDVSMFNAKNDSFPIV